MNKDRYILEGGRNGGNKMQMCADSLTLPISNSRQAITITCGDRQEERPQINTRSKMKTAFSMDLVSVYVYLIKNMINCDLFHRNH